jgi:hypothetical protein
MIAVMPDITASRGSVLCDCGMTERAEAPADSRAKNR